MIRRDPASICPACGLDDVDNGPCKGVQYADGAWIGCTKCGLSVSGPDARLVEAAWRAITRSTAVREIRHDPDQWQDLPPADF